jgi:uncharacterized protein YkwD
MFGIKLLFSILLFATSPAIKSNEVTKTTVTTEEYKLYELITEYRKANGLKKIPLSNSLTRVAQTHCKDLVENKPDLREGCNAHSWSDQGAWTSCCYTADHRASNCMWKKPQELTSYQGYGFEIAAGSSQTEFNDFVMSPQYALSMWKKSIHHNNVILNRALWRSSNWNAIGVGIHKGFACVWFGKETDPEGEPNR